MTVTSITVALAVDVDERAWARYRACEDAQDRLILGDEHVRAWASLASTWEGDE